MNQNDDVDVIESLLDTDTEEEKSLTINVYNEIRLRLAKQGIPPEEIAFIHDARNPQQRAALFKAVNEGKIRVLIGSNEKMGTGLNVQERCVATHHITPPWRPGDLEQQLGRMWRQGNRFPTVFQFVHITEKSFDGYTWQLLENKAGFISQIMAGSVTDREMEDIGDTVLTFSEIKGLASGNPKIMQKIVLDTEYARMNALRSSWLSSLHALRQDIRWRQIQLETDRNYLVALKEAIQVRDANTTEEFSVELKQVFGGDATCVIAKREDAGRDIKLLAEQAAQKVLRSTAVALEIGRYKGHTLWTTCTDLNETPLTYFDVGGRKFEIGGTDNVGITRSLDMALKSLDEKARKCEEAITAWEKNIASAEEELNRPWDHEEKFKALEVELQTLEAELRQDAPSREAGQDNTLRQAQDNAPVIERKSISLAGQGITDVRDALDAIKAMMSDPETLVRFEDEPDEHWQPIPITTESLVELGEKIEQMQALYELGAVLQLSLFGDAPVTRKRSRR
jgi:hypothetical protein